MTIALWTFPPLSQSSDFLSFANISDTDLCKGIKRLNISKYIGLYNIPGFVIKGCSVIFILILRHIYYLSLTQQYFLIVWKEAAVLPLFKSGNHDALYNYRPTSILNHFSKLFAFIIHDHVLHYVELNPNQYGSTKSKSAVINFVTFLQFKSSVSRDQLQTVAIYFDL
jgi:hypothetical protein